MEGKNVKYLCFLGKRSKVLSKYFGIRRIMGSGYMEWKRLLCEDRIRKYRGREKPGGFEDGVREGLSSDYRKRFLPAAAG